MLAKTMWLLVCVTVVAFSSCQKDNISPKVPAVDNPSGTASTNINKTTLLQLVNNVRQGLHLRLYCNATRFAGNLERSTGNCSFQS